MYTLGAGRILIKSIIIVCLLNLLAWKASWAHRTGETEKKDNDKIKKSRSKRRAPVVCMITRERTSYFKIPSCNKSGCHGPNGITFTRLCNILRVVRLMKSVIFLLVLL